MAEWKDVEIGFGDSIEPISDALSSTIGTLVSVVEVGVSVLEVLSSFLVVSGNPISAAMQLLLSEIQTILADLEQTGVHGLFMVPTSHEELVQHKGGYGKFEQMFLNSIHDIEDPERPQIASSGFMGGLFLILTAPNPSDFIKSFMRLYRYFDRRFDVRYPAPVGVKIRQADEFGIPLENIFWLWDDDLDNAETLRLEWQEPRVANDILLDFYGNNKFYIERSKSREGKLQLKSKTPRNKQTPLDKKREADGKTKKLYEAALDEFNDPIFYWEPVDPDDPFVDVSDTLDIANNRVNFLSGSYAYILEDVEKGSENGYYYRVRSVPSDTTLKKKAVAAEDAQGNYLDSTEVYELQLDGKSIGKYAEPNPPVFGYIPDVDPDFDLPTALLNVYRAAYLLRFDTDYRDNLGDSVKPSILKNPLNEKLYPRLEETEIYEYQEQDPDGTLVDRGLFYWGGTLFENRASVMTHMEAKQELKKDLFVDPASFDPFGGADEFMLPRLDQPDRELLRNAIDRKAANSIKKLVALITANESLYDTFQQLYTSAEDDILELLTSGVTLIDIIEATDKRSTIYTLLQLVGDPRPGAPPNWESLRLLEDLFPFANEIANKLFDSISALNNMLLDTLAELEGTLDAARDRLAAITAILDTIEDLLVILEELAALNVGMYALHIPPTSGGTPKFISEFINAANPPDTENSDFVGGVVLAYGGAGKSDIEGIANAFKLIFGN